MSIKSDDNATVTIKDVAKLADVSIKTVSRVANNEPNVRKETRVRVQSAINKLGYWANPHASTLGRRRNKLDTKRMAALKEEADLLIKSLDRNIDWW